MNQKNMSMTPEANLVPDFPPSSAPPSGVKKRLSISRPIVDIANTVYKITLKARSPAGTSNVVP